MKIVDFGYRKLFPFMLGLVMAVGCNKKEVSNDVVTGDEDSPVAISLSVGNPTYVSTKVALEEWNNSKLNVFGLKRKPTAVVGKNAYDFEDAGNIVDYEVTAASGEKSQLNVYSDKEGEVPYFYSETHIYDFYGYHLGGAVASTPEIKDGDAYGFDVTFLGDNDLMYAHTNKADDIVSSGSTEEKIAEADLYSAWSARRGVHPTLVFDHALARLNFIVQGKGDKYSTVRITGVDVKSVNKGYLTVTGDNVGFVVDPDAEETTLSLRTAGKESFDAVQVDQNTAGNHLGDEGACLLVAPGMDQIEMEIHMEHTDYNIPIESYKYTVKASEVKKEVDGNLVPVTSFEAGLSYDFYVYVYGPEEILVDAKVAKWEPGGSVEIDPDKPLSGGGSDDEGDDEGGAEGGDNSGEDDDDPVDQPVAVTGVSLDQTTLSMTVGDKVTLDATVSPDNATVKSYTWKSSNYAVADVLYGVVTAVGEGEAVITVTTVDGGFTATCSVTVAAKPQDSGSTEGVGEDKVEDGWDYEG